MDIQYKIIGGDEAEYGPASLTELKSWIRDGRVAGMTKVWRSDLSNWSPADRYTELLEDLARLNAAAAAAIDRALPPAGFWPRLLAFLIDYFFLVFILCLLWGPLAAMEHWQLPPIPTFPANLTDASVQQYREQVASWSDKAPSGLFVTFMVLYLIYDVALNGRYGATLGKMVIRARIVMLDGSPIGYHRALLRWMAARLSDIFFLGYLVIGLRRDKRAFHDLLVGTKVVFKR